MEKINRVMGEVEVILLRVKVMVVGIEVVVKVI